ncbi:MAG: RNA-binding transcriptional accessory protein [Lachnospiraceae bacterium]|nr:RNA-binding transcriptional accessory protein [Lachnospiraceae bacterium]
MDIISVITGEQNLQKWQAEAVTRLIDEGNTIPFIARYRKEAHGAMNDEQLRAFDERLRYLRSLEERKQTVLASIDEQGKLTDELKKAIDEALTQTAVEDLYRPYKQKRRTRAMIAREKGLEPLAQYILSPKAAEPVEIIAQQYVDEEKEIPDVQTAIRMAQDIIAEMISDDAAFRTWIREKTMREGLLVSEQSKAAKAGEAETSGKKSQAAGAGRSAEAPVNKKLAERAEVYTNYYEYSEPLEKIPGHRILAINRGENEKFLKVGIEAPEDSILEYLARKMNKKRNPVTDPYIRAAAEDAYKRLIAPSIETEIRNALTEKAEEGAMKVFSGNLHQLLMQAPIQGKTVLGWDPAFRTGCKLAVVDPTGKVMDTTVIYPTAPQNKIPESERILDRICRQYNVDVISVGNGTASRESEQVIVDFIKKSKLPVKYVIVNEAGASVYSASKLATEEFPQFDVGQRSAASIARRLQDPLAELVKIDPKAIGVGQYQHDMNQTKLGETLTAVVEDCVNSVGVDVNTASAALLEYISGINKTTAKNMVEYREQNGRFKSRREFLKVPKLGPKAFEQCAGFLRIRDGKEPLDMTGVHPESYGAAEKLLTALGFSSEDILSGATAQIRKKTAAMTPAQKKALAEETGLGEYTLQDILSELEKPGRDPREDVPGPVLRSDVLDMKDLTPGMVLTGTVRNVVDFGAFVDIGVHQDGLVHISRICDRYIKHPLDVIKVGDIVKVKVLEVDQKRGRISLTMRDIDN